MLLQFHDLNELQAFLNLAGYVHLSNVEAISAHVASSETLRNEGSPAGDVETKTYADGTIATGVPPLPGQSPAADAAPEQKRKRRTKAEMEAAKAAESGSQTVAAPVEPISAPANDGNPFAQGELPPATATVQDVVDTAKPVAIDFPADAAQFIAARVAERPEVSPVEHLNMARAFIGKHGMEAYGKAATLAGTSNNVMAYEAADRAKHAAALDFLSLE